MTGKNLLFKRPLLFHFNTNQNVLFFLVSSTFWTFIRPKWLMKQCDLNEAKYFSGFHLFFSETCFCKRSPFSRVELIQTKYSWTNSRIQIWTAILEPNEKKKLKLVWFSFTTLAIKLVTFRMARKSIFVFQRKTITMEK